MTIDLKAIEERYKRAQNMWVTGQMRDFLGAVHDDIPALLRLVREAREIIVDLDELRGDYPSLAGAKVMATQRADEWLAKVEDK